MAFCKTWDRRLGGVALPCMVGSSTREVVSSRCRTSFWEFSAGPAESMQVEKSKTSLDPAVNSKTLNCRFFWAKLPENWRIQGHSSMYVGEEDIDVVGKPNADIRCTTKD